MSAMKIQCHISPSLSLYEMNRVNFFLEQIARHQTTFVQGKLQTKFTRAKRGYICTGGRRLRFCSMNIGGKLVLHHTFSPHNMRISTIWEVSVQRFSPQQREDVRVLGREDELHRENIGFMFWAPAGRQIIKLPLWGCSNGA